MHVLVAANNLFPEPDATGSGRYNHEVGRRLAERGHEVTVVTRRRGDAPARETVAGMDVRRYRASIPRLPWTLREIGRHVEAAAAAGPIDVASLHGALSSLGVHRAVPDRTPRVYTVHGLWAVEYRERAADEGGRSPWHRLNERLRHRVESYLLGASDSAVVLSEFMRERLERFHRRAPPCTVVPGGVDPARFAPRRDFGGGVAAPDGVGFLTVRRLTRRMGLETLLDAFARVGREHPDAHLYVGGDGPLRDDLESRAARLGVASDVTFLGYVPEERLPAAYAAADAFVLPTLALEGFGLATLEALAAGTPAIGTTAGATPEILGPLEGEAAIPEPLLVEPGNADALAAAMAAWARLPADRRVEAGRACREYVLESGYTWERVTDRIEAHFDRVRT